MRLDSIVRIEFLWYWLDGTGHWIEYGKKHSEHCPATVSSSDLEAAFLADQRGIVFFRAGSQLYELNFRDMVQRNLYYRTQRKVCRWPRLVFFGGEQTHGKGCLLELSSLPFHLFPSSWDHSALPDIGYKNTSGEIKVVNSKWKDKSQSLRQKEQMKKKNGGKEVDERLLFHGTSTSHLHEICGQNFDWRICGTHGTLYGKGSYFAKDAIYSHRYCKSDSRFQMMFVARVLVGDYIQGNVAYLRPPHRPDQRNSFYDSCVDILLDPSIFVIFEKHQIYPEYIIEYRQASQCTIM
uniref:Uncharacterized protein n=1 Tax=Sphaerodactylus townsendi TaxID=933632 RepID=A0ACB8FNK2_9SAUR